MRALSAVVLLVVAVIAVAGFVVTRQVVHDQEKRLLEQRADEAGPALAGAAGSVQNTLSALAGTAALKNANPASFSALATPLTQGKSGFKSAALIRTGSAPPAGATPGRGTCE